VLLVILSFAVALLAFRLDSQTISTNIWMGPGDGSNNWSSASNWSLGRVPGPGDYVMFTDAGSSATVSNINNVVDSGFAGTIGTLHYANSNGFHTTLIAPGQTLVLTGDLIAGAGPPSCASRTVNITGPGGVLMMSSTSNSISIGDHFTYGCNPKLTLDMSGLDRFTADVGRLLVPHGDGASGIVFAGLVLARANTITAAGAPPAILVSDGEMGPFQAGAGDGALVLGQTSTVLADSITIGSGFPLAGSELTLVPAYLGFNTKFTNSSVVLRGQYGTNRIDEVVVADGVNWVGSWSEPGAPTTVDLSSGTVDLQANTLIISRIPTNDRFAETSGSAQGTLSFSRGTMDVNTLYLGLNSWGNGSAAQGTLNVQGTAKLVVNSAMVLGISTNGNPYGLDRSTETMGALNISGGTVTASSIQAGFFSTNNTIAMTNGTLIVSSTMGPGIANFLMADSVLQLPAANTAGAIVTNLTTGGTSNILNISSVIGLSSFPTQVALIKYTGAIAGAGFNLRLGTLPSPGYTGYLSNNAANSSVDLVLAALTLAGRMTNGGFQLTIYGEPGRVIDLLISTNLEDWDWLATLTNTTGAYVFADPSSSSVQRLYRAHQIQ
jgi:hypothetical protein